MTTEARVLYSGKLAGKLIKTDNGYTFTYDKIYLANENAMPVSQTLPLSPYPYHSKVLFSFFDGLIPEGWLLNLARQHWNIKGTDRFELLITLCRDTIGAVTIEAFEEEVKNA